jgi:hypothetical protein
MSDYSDLIFLTGAMIVFSMLSMNTTRNFQSTAQRIYQTDIEYRALSLAQDEIEVVRWAKEKHLNPDDGNNYLYDDDPVQRTIYYGNSDQYSETFELKRSSLRIENSSDMRRYRVQVIVESDAVTPAISDTLEYIKSFMQN